jgi:phosphate transport system substrate-binding protein
MPFPHDVRLLPVALVAALASGGYAVDASSGDASAAPRGSYAPVAAPLIERIEADYRGVFSDGGEMIEVRSGDAFARLCAGALPLTIAARQPSADEQRACEAAAIDLVEIPLAFDAVVLAVPRSNDFVDHLTVDELRAIWSPASRGRALRWSDVREGWPDAPLRLYGPAVDDGALDSLSAALFDDPEARRDDYAVADERHLAAAILGDADALGAMSYEAYRPRRHHVRAVPIVNDDGVAVFPSEETVSDGLYRPLTRPIAVYVSAAALDDPAVERFVSFALADVSRVAEELGAIALAPLAYEVVGERLAARATGLLFDDRWPSRVASLLTGR